MLKENKRNRLGGRKKYDLIFCLCVVALPVIHFLIFYVFVNFNSILLAFKSYTLSSDGSVIMEWVGFKNFKEFIQNIFGTGSVRLDKAVINSLIVYAVGLIVGVPLTLAFSFYIYKKLCGYKVFTVLLYLPSVISSIVMVLLFSFFADRLIPKLLNDLFHLDVTGLLSGSSTMRLITVIFYNNWVGFGMGILVYSSAMGRIPPELSESAMLDGCGSFREFWKITLPLIFPTISVFLVVGVSGIFLNQANLYSFFSYFAEPDIQTVGYYFFVETMFGRESYYQFPPVAAGGLILTAVIVPITLFVRWFLNKFDYGSEF